VKSTLEPRSASHAAHATSPSPALRVLNVACVRWWSALAHYAHSAALSLRRRGHEVLVAGSRGSPYVERCRDSGMPVAEEIDPTRGGPLGFLRTLSGVRNLLRSGGVNVLLVHSGSGHVELALARQGVSAPHVLVRARPEIRPPRPYPWNLWVHGRATDRVLLSGDFMRAKHYRRWPVPPGRMAVARGALDTDDFSRARWAAGAADARGRLGIPSGAVALGIIGRLSPVKGHRTALAGILPLLAVDDSVHLLVMGGEAQLSWDELAREIPERIRARVHYTGHVEAIAPYAAACDVGVIPSTGSEAVCRVAMEWMALGVPVVGTSVHVIPEIVRDGVTGWIVPPGDARTLRRVMESVLGDLDEARRRGRRGEEVAREEFSLDAFGRRLEVLLARALRDEPWT
jgi:glycosyltransferase involved in cell wall biosynthesis